jgi:hypothetical protein
MDAFRFTDRGLGMYAKEMTSGPITMNMPGEVM